MIGLSRATGEPPRQARITQSSSAKGSSVNIEIDTIQRTVKNVPVITGSSPVTIHLKRANGTIKEIVQAPNQQVTHDVSGESIPVLVDTRNRPNGTSKTVMGPEWVAYY